MARSSVQTAPPSTTSNTVTHDLIQYQSEVRTATLGGREIRVEHLTPVLSPEDREARKREIEALLFDVFVKYTGNQAI